MARGKHAADQLDREIDLVRLLTALGVAMAGAGPQRTGACPFHVGDTVDHPLAVDVQANTWTCPTCAPNPAGVIEFVARAEGVSRHHAITMLRSGAELRGTALHRRPGHGSGLIKRTTVRDLDTDFAVEAEAELLRAVMQHGHRTLLDTPEALGWLEKRGLPSDMVENFGLGFANRTLGLKLPTTHRAAGRVVRARLQAIGVLRESGHEHFNGCVTFPVLDADGNVVQIYGRKITAGLRAGTPLHLYLHEDKRGVFNLAGVVGAKTVILCEGVIDALSFVAHGHRNATCTFGTKLTSDIRRLLAQPVERLLIAFDRDTEGDEGAVEVAKELADLPIEILRVALPRGMDPNDVAKSKNPAEVLDRMVRHAEWLAGAGKPNVPKVPKATAPKAVERPKPSPPPTPEPVVNKEPVGDELAIEFDDRQWRVRGLLGNTAHGTLRLNVLVRRVGVGFHVDLFDLYSARHRGAFVKLASEEICLDEQVIKSDLGHILLSAELAQADLLQQRQTGPLATADEMTVEDRDAALELLRWPLLLDRVTSDLDRCGLVGEATNKLILYLAVTSRLLDDPLAVLVRSSSAAGKTSLMAAVLAFVPDEHRREFSAMTGQALYYLGATELRHKVLAIAEEGGAARASYALKLLQSDGRLVLVSTAKDPQTGRLTAKEYAVEGPIALLTTSTSLDLDEELANRCIVLAVDEGQEQTTKIHERQRVRFSLDGVLARSEQDAIVKLHRDAQRLLSPILVVIPGDAALAFDGRGVRARRDHRKLLGLVRSVTLLHQYQRDVQVHHDDDGHELRYLIASEADIAIARRLFVEVTHGLDLSPHTARVLDAVERYEGATLAELAERVGVGRTRTWVHLQRLRRLDFIVGSREPGQATKFRALAPASTIEEPALDSRLDGPHSPPFAPRSPPSEIENSQRQTPTASSASDDRFSDLAQARAGAAEESRRTCTRGEGET